MLSLCSCLLCGFDTAALVRGTDRNKLLTRSQLTESNRLPFTRIRLGSHICDLAAGRFDRFLLRDEEVVQVEKRQTIAMQGCAATITAGMEWLPGTLGLSMVGAFQPGGRRRLPSGDFVTVVADSR